MKADPAEIAAALSAITTPGQVVELRALDVPNGGSYTQTLSGYFDDISKLAHEASRIRGAVGIYFTLNPVLPSILARSHNRVKPVKKDYSTGDHLIARRRNLLIDVDADRPTGISSTDEEHEAAIEKVLQIREDLRLEGWPEPVLADSGNGGHLIYPIDLPPNDGGLISRVLAKLAEKYDDPKPDPEDPSPRPACKIDQTVFNPARISKLYGTIARKGDSTDERPHRKAKIIECPDVASVVTLEMLEDLAGPVEQPTPKKTQKANGKEFDLADWLRTHNVPVGPEEDWSSQAGRGKRWVFDVCPWNSEHTNRSAFVGQRGDGKITAGCLHNGCRGKDWHDLRDLYEPIRKSIQKTPQQSNQNDNLKSEPLGEPIPLEVPPPPEMPAGIFPPIFDDMICAQAMATETPIELGAVFALVSLATACQGRFCVRPEPGYFEQLAIWAAAALRPGERKTPVVNSMMNWACEWQHRKAREFEQKIKQAEADDSILRARVKVLRDKATKAKDETEYTLLKQQADDAEALRQPIPIAPRLGVEDITTEHLATMLSRHKERLTDWSDEAGPLDNWAGRYSGGVANIDLPLKAWSASPATVDRGSKPAAMLRHPLLSIGLAPQPEVIGGIVGNEIFRRRGFPSRFIFFLPAPRVGTRTLKTQPVPQEIIERYTARLTELVEMEGKPDGEGGYVPRPLSLSGDAWKTWKDFALEIEREMGSEGSLEGLRDWGAKLPGQTIRVAGLFHLAQHGADAIRLDEIQLDTMHRAIAFVRAAIPHAKAVFEGMDAKGYMELARKVWADVTSNKRIRERRDDDRDPAIVTARELWTPIRSTKKAVLDAEPVIRLLIDHNHIQELPNAEHGKPGRPSRRFRVNPALTGDW